MGWVLWVFPLFLFFLVPSQSHSSPLCDPQESSSLLNFKNSFSITNDYIGTPSNITALWGIDKDCCNWRGVTCDNVTGHVVGLELTRSGLKGVIDSNSSLFSLTHLQSLDLSINDLKGSSISPNFGRFSSLLHLDLSYCSFTGYIPPELAYLSNLLTLHLACLTDDELRVETSSLKRIIANLTSLTDLRLGTVNMFDVLPNSFTNISTSLISLVLFSNQLKMRFPDNIFWLPNLQFLSLSDNPGLTGSLPQKYWTSQLKILLLYEIGLQIDITYLSQTLKKLTALRVRRCSDVKVPFSFASLSNIHSLDISGTNLGGQIPWGSLKYLSQLTSLDLSDNKFEGQLPYFCSNSSSEKGFLCDSSNHQLLGPLPLSLQDLILNNNLLSGTIPTWLYSLPNLEFLDLGNNKFSGIVILEHFLELRRLYYLDLSFNSLLSVISIPHANFTVLKSNYLSHLSLSSCNISHFPIGLKSLDSLTHLDLSQNKIEGSIPPWLWKLSKHPFGALNLSYNSLSHISPIPPLNNSFTYIDLRSNRIQGHLPNLPQSIVAFFASNNQLNGGISSLICNNNILQVLDLSNNNFNGSILPCLGNFGNSLSVLDLRMNKFVGIVPSAFSNESSLRTLNLNGNRLKGSLPQSLLNSKSLEVLDVGNNELYGVFPHFLDSLPQLKVLILRSNRFHGTIRSPKSKVSFQNLRIIDLSDNKFTGVLPVKYFENLNAMIGAHASKLEYIEYNQLTLSYYQDSVTVVMKGYDIELVRIQTLFTTIDFSKNGFTGGIPKTIGKLNSLKGLNLSHNSLTGPIPPLLGDLINLEWLELSYNKLVGPIPQQLASNLNQLNSLNLAENNLTGTIPQGNQFNTFSNNSYDGNSGLCGFPLTKPCSGEEDDNEDGDDEPSRKEKLTWKLFAIIGYGAGLGIGVSIGYTMFFTRRFDFWLQKNIVRQQYCKSLAEIIMRWK